MINKNKTVELKAYISKKTYEIIKECVKSAKELGIKTSISWFVENAINKYIEEAVRDGIIE